MKSPSGYDQKSEREPRKGSTEGVYMQKISWFYVCEAENPLHSVPDKGVVSFFGF